MATIQPSTYTKWNLSEEEVLSGAILSFSQKTLLQNDLANIAEQRLSLDLDPRNVTKFAQDEAFLKGQIAIMRLVLERSDAAEIEIRTRATT